MSVEEFYEGKDFQVSTSPPLPVMVHNKPPFYHYQLSSSAAHSAGQSSITREAFEGLVADFFQRASAPLLRIIERNGLKPEDIDSVELLGGGSRVPKLQVRGSEGEGRQRVSDSLPPCSCCPSASSSLLPWS